MIKAIIFDVGGVLKITDIKATKENIVTQFGISPKLVDKGYKKYLQIWKNGQIVESELWQKIINDYVTDHQNFQRIFELNQPVYKIANHLKKLGYQTAIMSNVTFEDKSFNEKVGLYKPFETVVLSIDVGIKKPNPEIYLLTLKKLNIKPEESIFIDDREQFVDIAKSLGINGIVYLNPSQLQKDLENLLAVNLSEC